MHWNSDKLSDGRRNGVNYGFQVTNTDAQTEKNFKLSDGMNTYVMYGLVGF